MNSSGYPFYPLVKNWSKGYKEFPKLKGEPQKFFFFEKFIKCLDHFQIRKKNIKTLIIEHKFIYLGFLLQKN